jgi:hypothetical protein
MKFVWAKNRFLESAARKGIFSVRKISLSDQIVDLCRIIRCCMMLGLLFVQEEDIFKRQFFLQENRSISIVYIVPLFFHRKLGYFISRFLED